jgi:hypothetical protein
MGTPGYVQMLIVGEKNPLFFVHVRVGEVLLSQMPMCIPQDKILLLRGQGACSTLLTSPPERAILPRLLCGAHGNILILNHTTSLHERLPRE